VISPISYDNKGKGDGPTVNYLKFSPSSNMFMI